MLKALIFDVDGTLAETERDGHRVAFNDTFRAAGLDWHWSVETYGSLINVAGGKERIRHYINTVQPPIPPDTDLDILIAELHQAKTHRYRTLLQTNGIALRPGVRRLITAARSAGVSLAIATTSHLDNAIALLEATLGPDTLTWFEVIAAGDIVPHKKPAPDIYYYVLEKLALPPQHCLVIEDSHQGLTAATTAGLCTVITVNAYTRHHDFGPASLVLSHLGEPDQPWEILQGPGIGHGPSEPVFDPPIFTLATANTLLDSGYSGYQLKAGQISWGGVRS